MNLLEAIKSGKRFKRPHWDIYYSSQMEEELQLSIEELLAEDWEVELKKVTITEEDFNKAVARTGNLYHQDQWYWADALKKELGL
jgi:hypothetical protein